MSIRRRGRGSDEDGTSGPPRASGRGRHAEPRSRAIVRTARRLMGPAILAVVTVGVFTLGAFPTRTLLDQRHETSAAEQRLGELDASNAAEREKVEALKTDAMVEQLARREYGLARPGEELYHMIPPAQDPVRVPDAWPFNGLGTTLDR
ncbi:MAG TPA: septum formation initiator family protein [Acidimicrobiales bacterium]